ncbi:MAG: hypothetical protein ACKVHH_03965 [Candidatus Poseidoniales archaeon]
MEISREILRMTVYIFGTLVLASYVFGISRMDDPNQLWGGIPESWRPLNIACMFVAATGFLIMWWFFLYRWDAAAVEMVQWPWGNGVGGGNTRLFIALLLFLIPSILWLELTAYHVRSDYNWTKWLVIGNLLLVCIGNILLGLFALGAHQQNVQSGTIWPLFGAVMLAIQVIINDGILWNLKYPW